MNSAGNKPKLARSKYQSRMYKEYVYPLVFIILFVIFIIYAREIFKQLIHRVPKMNIPVDPPTQQPHVAQAEVTSGVTTDLPVPSRIGDDGSTDIRFDYYQSSLKLPKPTLLLDSVSIKTSLSSYPHDNSSSSFIDHIFNRTPVGYFDSSARGWNALNWDLWSLSNVIPILLGVIRRADDETIMTPLDMASPMMMMENGELTNSINTSSMFGWNLLNELQIVVYSEFAFVNFLFLSTDLNSGFMHFSTNYKALEEIFDLESDTDWKQFRIHEYLFKNSNFSSNSSKSMIWLNYPGSVMQTRYDEDHSFRVQLQGTCRIHVFPPESFNYLNYFPITHIFNHQSQIDFSHPDESFNASQLMVQEFVLSPGDVLYIPPFHSYRYESINFTVSLNIRSASEENARLLEAYMQWLPYAEFAKTRVERVVVSQIFLIQLISRATSSSPKKFSRDLLKFKWYPLFSNSSSSWQYYEYFTCFESEMDLVKNIVKRMPDTKTKQVAGFISDAINHETISKAVRNIWLGNYIEEAARWAMIGFQPTLQDGQEISEKMKDELEGIKAAIFIKKCLNYERVEIVEDVEGPSVLRI